jgi:hypothetical protein
MSRKTMKQIQALVAEAVPQVEESLTEYGTGDLVTVLENLTKIAELCQATPTRQGGCHRPPAHPPPVG